MSNEISSQELTTLFNSINTVRTNLGLITQSIPTNLAPGNAVITSDFTTLRDAINYVATNDPLPPPVPGSSVSFDSGEVADGRPVKRTTYNKLNNAVDSWLYYARTLSKSTCTQGYSQGYSYSYSYSKSNSQSSGYSQIDSISTNTNATNSAVRNTITNAKGEFGEECSEKNSNSVPCQYGNNKSNSITTTDTKSDSRSTTYSDSNSISTCYYGNSISNTVVVREVDD